MSFQTGRYRMRKFIYGLICGLLLAGCGTKAFVSADMSGYQYLEDDKPAFYEMTVQDMKDRMDAGDTFVVYFGFADCPWCNECVPVLNETAKEVSQTVGYVNTRKDAAWKSNTDIDGYDLLKEMAKEYLKPDEEGVPHLYAPTVIFIRNGKITKFCEGLIEGYKPSDGRMTEQEQNTLKQIYLDGFESLHD